MDKILQRHIKDIRRYILPEGLEKLKIIMEEYGEYRGKKILKNNKRLIKMYTQKLYDEFTRLTTHTISNKKDIWK